jgi:rod shape-determining protein MreB
MVVTGVVTHQSDEQQFWCISHSCSEARIFVLEHALRKVGMSAPAMTDSVARPNESASRITGSSVAVAVDFGSECVRLWASHRGTLSVPTSKTVKAVGSIVRRGRVIDGPGCVAVVADLIGRFEDPIRAGASVVACRPVLATQSEITAMRSVLTEALKPSRLVFIETVRAAAVGAGSAAGALLLADIGAQLSELAVLYRGRVMAARKVDIGTRDLDRGASASVLVDSISSMVDDLRRDPSANLHLAAALRRGVIAVGHGALKPELTGHLARNIGVPVHCAAAPRTAAIIGAGLAAKATTLRRSTHSTASVLQH